MMSPLPNPQKTLYHVQKRGKNHQRQIGRSLQLIDKYSRVSFLQKRRDFLNCYTGKGFFPFTAKFQSASKSS